MCDGGSGLMSGVGPDELRVSVRAAGLNRADLLDIKAMGLGAAQRSGRPRGRELAGEVIAVGDRVTGWSVGDPVMALGPGFAEEATVRAAQAIHMPDELSFEEAGAMPLALLTMHDAIVTNGHLGAEGSGGRVLIHAVTSGVGMMAVKLCAVTGASRVYGTSRSAAKLNVLRSFLGRLACPFDAIDTSTVSFEAVATDVDLVIDNVGASVLSGNLAACRVGGHIIQVGRLGGRMAEVDLDEVARKRLTIVGVTFRTRSVGEVDEVVRRAMLDVGTRLTELRPRIERVYSLDALESAFTAMEADRHVGKLVVKP